MRKILLVLTLALLATGCSISQSNVLEIESVNFKTKEITTLAGNSGDAEIIIDALNKKTKTDVDTVIHPLSSRQGK